MAILLAVAGCAEAAPPGACTELFASYAVTVVDATGAPVEQATVTALLVRTGQVLVPEALMLYPPGTYPLIDDGSTALLRQSGDQVRATVSKDEASLAVDYLFALPGGCHLSKVSGPDTVVFQP